MRNKQSKFNYSPSLLPWESFLRHREGRPEAWWFPKMQKQSKALDTTVAPVHNTEDYSWLLHRKEFLKSAPGLPWFLTGPCIWEEQIGQRYLKKLEWSVISTHRRPGIISVLRIILENLKIHGALGRPHRRALPQEWGILSPTLNTALVLTSKS